MSLMKKMARLIQQDIKRTADRAIEESPASFIKDYPKASAYKSEQEDIWKKLYDNLYYISNNLHYEIAESIKTSVHNYDDEDQVVAHPSSVYGAMNRWVAAADDFLKGELKYKKEDLEQYTQEILKTWKSNGDVYGPLMKWKELDWLIDQIDWSKPKE